MTTGDRIKRLRNSKGFSQEELGVKIGVKKAAINKYENGIVVNLKREIIEKLADALETTPAYIMGFEDEEMPTPDSESGHSAEFAELMSQLTPDEQKLIVSQIKGILSNRE